MLRNKCYIFILCATIFLSSTVYAAEKDNTQNQVILSQAAKYELAPDVEVSHIIIKFKEGTGIRLQNGVLMQKPLISTRPDFSIIDIISGIEMIESIAKAKSFAIERQFHALREEELDQIRQKGIQRTGKKLADLNLYYTMKLPKGSTYKDVNQIISQINDQFIVEVAYAEPIPEPAAILVTPNYEPNQGYLNEPPNGINARSAWTLPGGKGQNVKIVDVEGAWRITHEDMPALFFDSGNHYTELLWRNHGTAVVGVMAAQDNTYGITGISNDALIGIQSVNGTTTANAVANAANNAGAGGIVLIELHSLGPSDGTPCSFTCNYTQCNYIAEEYWQATFDAIATATANGVVVIEAAGNGTANLDSTAYGGAFDRNIRDSGAIMVGASLSSSREPTCWTNFGSRVDVHGWGENVYALGYGDLFAGNNEEDRYYTAVFGGTSSASPIVVGAAAIVQGVQLARNLPPLTSTELRNLLVSTGTLQTNDLARHIGPLPDVCKATATNPVQQWARAVGFINPNSGPNAGSLSVDGLGNVYVVNGSNSLTKYNDTGELQWSVAGISQIAADSSGNAYAITSIGQLQKLSGTGTLQWSIENVSGSPSIDSSGNIYVINVDAKTLKKFNSSGVLLWTATIGSYSRGPVIDTSGNVYVVSLSGNTLKKFNSSGILQWTKSTAASPFKLALDGSGNIYIITQLKLQKFNSAGTLQWTVTPTYAPRYLAVDDSGNVYVTHSHLQKFNNAGTSQWMATTSNAPTSIGLDSNGNVYVISMYNDSLQKFNSAGTSLWTVWGLSPHPNALVVDDAGNTYVATADSTYNTGMLYKYNGGCPP